MGRTSKPHPNHGGWRFRFAGRPVWRKTLEEAEYELARLKLKAKIGGEEPITISELIERWGAEQGGEWQISMLDEFPVFCTKKKQINLDKISPNILHQYKKYLEKRPNKRKSKAKGTKRLADETIRKWVFYAASVLKFAQKNGWIEHDIELPRLKPSSAKPKALSPEELQAFLAKLDAPRSQLILRLVQLALATGIRPKNLRLLKWSDVDLKRQVIVLADHKTVKLFGEPLIVPLSPRGMEVLSNQPRTDSAYVFISSLGTPYTESGLSRILRRKGASPYRLRHTFAQAAIDQGIPPEIVSKLMGHKKSQMVWMYAAIKDQRLHDAASSLVSPEQASLASQSPHQKQEARSSRNRDDRPSQQGDKRKKRKL